MGNCTIRYHVRPARSLSTLSNSVDVVPESKLRSRPMVSPSLRLVRATVEVDRARDRTLNTRLTLGQYYDNRMSSKPDQIGHAETGKVKRTPKVGESFWSYALFLAAAMTKRNQDGPQRQTPSD